MDESVKQGIPVVLLTIGALNGTENKHSFSRPLSLGDNDYENANAEVIMTFTKECLAQIWPEVAHDMTYDLVRVGVSDAAGYMRKAARLMKETFAPNIIHIYCTTHGLHLVADKIRALFGDVEKFMSLMTSVMCNSVARKRAFKNSSQLELTNITNFPVELASDDSDLEENVLPQNRFAEVLSNPFDQGWNQLFASDSSDIWLRVWDKVCSTYTNTDEQQETTTIRLPPHPVKTRFGTWIVAVSYYHQHWEETCNFILQLDSKASNNQKRLKKLQKLLREQGNQLKQQIDTIFENFGRLPVFIAQSEADNLELHEAQAILDRAREYLEVAANKDPIAMPGQPLSTSRKVLEKFDQVCSRNKESLEELLNLAKDKEFYKYAPATSAPIERGFSAIDHTLGNKRHFKKKNFTRHVESFLNFVTSPLVTIFFIVASN